MPVIDTTALVSMERRPDAFASFLAGLRAEGEPLVVPVQAAMEYACGVADPAEAMRKLRQAFILVPMGPEMALEGARLAQRTRRAGDFPGWADIHIGATAHHEGMAVVTRNRAQFEAMGLEVIEHP